VIGGAGAVFAHLSCSVLVTGVVHKRDIASVVGATQILVWFGYAIGGAVSGAIWTQYLPIRLQVHVTGPLNETKAMNDPLKYIKNLPTETRTQVIEAYSDAIKLMSIVGLAFAVLTLFFSSLLQHVNLEQDQDDQDRIALGKEAVVKKTEDVEVEPKN
ncbi:Siderophore transporter, partial [Actinomortierella ambigua]